MFKDPVAFAFRFFLFGEERLIEIKWYAIFVTTGIVAALILLAYLMRKRKDEFNSDAPLEIFLIVVPFAILFARLGFSLPRTEFPLKSFDDFIEIFAIWKGGATIVVGILGGAIGVLLFCKLRKKSVFRVADLIMPCLLLGQAIGRWGNLPNNELYGIEITNPALQFFPFGVEINGVWHCANFFYESIGNFIGLAIVLVMMYRFKDRIKVGEITLFYLMWYGLLRGSLEFVKVGAMTWHGIHVIQMICFIMAAVAFVLLMLVHFGKIKLESDKMRIRHFIKLSDPESNANNEDFAVTAEVIGESGEVNEKEVDNIEN